MARRRRKIPTFFSFEIGSLRGLAESMTDEEWGRWSKNALNDLSIGCVKKNTDPRVKNMFEIAKNGMDEEYKRKREWYEKNKAETTTEQASGLKDYSSPNQGNEQHTQPTPQQGKTEAPPQQKHLDTKKPGDLVYGSCENVFLTQDEFNKIAMDVGNLKEANSLVEDLSLNLADGKIESSNHFATLQKWAKWRKNHPNDERLETFHERDDRNQIETLRKVFSM